MLDRTRSVKRPVVWLIVGVVVAALAVLAGLAWRYRVDVLLWHGEERDLREAHPEVPVPEGAPTVLLLALDGVPRAVLYDALRGGRMPELATLLGGADLRHAHLEETMLSTLPSSTLAAWATIFTGEPPAQHGVVGNEYFARETRTFAAPAPVSLTTIEPVLLTYADSYADDLLAVPTIYERFRQVEPRFTAWVSGSQFHRGADRLLLAERSTVVTAVTAFAAPGDDDAQSMEAYAALDRECVETVIEALAEGTAPRLLTLYLTGPDHFAHGSVTGPEEALARYLVEIIDPLMRRVREGLAQHGALEDRAVVVISDHGHTEVMHDEAHALTTAEEDNPPSVVRGAGFRLRPFELEVDEGHDFDAVIAYGGAMAYVYVADRSTCATAGTACDWARPARWSEDVVPMAEAFFRASAEGLNAPSMRGSLDLVLARTPERGFEVYLGGGRTEPLAQHLAAHPRASYVAFEPRLQQLTDGPESAHVGDVILLAHNGDEPVLERRHYFAALYRSWHGSPSRGDSEVPFIVAIPSLGSAAIAERVRGPLGEDARLDDVASVLADLLAIPLPPSPSSDLRED